MKHFMKLMYLANVILLRKAKEVRHLAYLPSGQIHVELSALVQLLIIFKLE